MATSRKRGRNSGMFRKHTGPNSRILSFLDNISARIYWSFGHGFASGLFCGAEKSEQALENCLAVKAMDKTGLRENVTVPYRKAVASGMWESRLLVLADRLRVAFFHTRARFIGIIGFLFSAYSVAGFLLKYYLSFSYGQTSLTDLALGAVGLLCSILLLFAGKPIGSFLSESRVFGRVFIGVLGIDSNSLRLQENERITSRGGLAFVLGSAMGIAAIFLSPHRILFATLQILFVLLVLAVPETGLLTSVLALPFAPLVFTAHMVAVSLLSYALKFFRLKRTFQMRVPELLMLLTVFAVFLAGASSGDYSQFCYALLFGSIWVLTVNLIKTGTLYRKYVACLMYGGTITLLISAAKYILGLFSLEEWIRYLPEWTLSENVLGAYLLILIPITLLHGKRWSGLLTLALIGVNAYFLGSMWVILGILFSILLYIIFAYRATCEAVVLGAITIPITVTWMGDRLAGFTTAISETAKSLCAEYWLTGVGSGNHVLQLATATNGLSPDGFTMNLYMRLLLEGGLPELVLLLLSTGAALQFAFTAIRNSRNVNAMRICGGIATAVLMLLVCGFAVDIWSDIRIIGLLWCLCPAASLSRDLYGRVTANQDNSKGDSV